MGKFWNITMHRSELFHPELVSLSGIFDLVVNIDRGPVDKVVEVLDHDCLDQFRIIDHQMGRGKEESAIEGFILEPLVLVNHDMEEMPFPRETHKFIEFYV